MYKQDILTTKVYRNVTDVTAFKHFIYMTVKNVYNGEPRILINRGKNDTVTFDIILSNSHTLDWNKIERLIDEYHNVTTMKKEVVVHVNSRALYTYYFTISLENMTASFYYQKFSQDLEFAIMSYFVESDIHLEDYVLMIADTLLYLNVEVERKLTDNQITFIEEQIKGIVKNG